MIALLLALALAEDCLVEPAALFGGQLALGAAVLDDGETIGPTVQLAGGVDTTFALGTSGLRLGPWADGSLAADPAARAAGGAKLTLERAPMRFRSHSYDSLGGALELRFGPGWSWDLPTLDREPEWVGSFGWTTRNDIQTHSITGSKWCRKGRWHRRAWTMRGIHGAYIAYGGGIRLDLGLGPQRWRVGIALTWTPGAEEAVLGQIADGLAADPPPRIPGSRADVHTRPGVAGRIRVDDRCRGEQLPWLALRIQSDGPPPDEIGAIRRGLGEALASHRLPSDIYTEGCDAKLALHYRVDDWTRVDAVAADVIAELRRHPEGHEVILEVDNGWP